MALSPQVDNSNFCGDLGLPGPSGNAPAQHKGFTWRDDGSFNGLDFPERYFAEAARLAVRTIADAMVAEHLARSKVRGGRIDGIGGRQRSSDDLMRKSGNREHILRAIEDLG